MLILQLRRKMRRRGALPRSRRSSFDHSRRGLRRRTGRGRRLTCAGDAAASLAAATRCAWARAASNSDALLARAFAIFWRQARYCVQILARLEGDVFPQIGSRPIAEIDAP